MKRPFQTVLQILFLVGLGAGLHFYFFPSGRTIQAASQAAGTPAEAERHLKNLKQLTFGGENAEAYWSFDGTRLIFQSTRDGGKADQIYVMNADGSGARRVSNGQGRTTCAYFMKGDERILYASTHLDKPEPPAPPDRSQGYVWGVFPGYDLFTAKPDGSDLKRLTETQGYDAEATVRPDGERIVFTSMRDGDLDLYSMHADGTQVRRLTREVGYDGGAFYSPDSRKICYRAHHPTKAEEVSDYLTLLKQHLVRPSRMELWVMDRDGSNKRQVTKNGAANFCPYFTPDGQRLIFASNMHDPQGRNFDLYLVNLDGSSLERVTTDPNFDGFPMFSPDGKRLVFASNRNAKARGETNLFVAEWVPWGRVTASVPSG